MHLNKLIVKMMSVLLWNIFHMIMKGLIISVFYPKTCLVPFMWEYKYI